MSCQLFDACALRLNELHVSGNLFLRLQNGAFAGFHGGIYRLKRALPLAADGARELVHALCRLLDCVNGSRQFFAGMEACVQFLHLKLMQPLEVRFLSLAVVFCSLELRAKVLAFRQLANLFRTVNIGISVFSPALLHYTN
jgi:hypothetical protein